jgi:hypothetical protein
MVASSIPNLIDPTTANALSAGVFAFFAMAGLYSPKQFMHGTKWPKGQPWFNPKLLPESNTAPLYQMVKFFSIVQLATIVVPILIEPHMQFMTYWVAIGSFLNIVHQIVFLLGVGPYKDATPDTKGGKGQWIFGTVMGAIFLIINVLASLHDQCTTVVGVPFVNAYYTGYPHVFPLLPINIILCVFGAINGIQLCIMPITFMSTWFGAPPEDIPKDYKAKKFMGLEVMPDNAAMTFFARNVGIHFVSLSITCAVTPIDGVSSVFYHPMFAMIGLLLFTSITANNIHAMQLQDAPGTTAKHYKMTYVPQIIIGLGIAAICLCTMIRLSPPLHGISKAGWEAAGVAEDRAEALSQISPIWEWRNGSSYQHIPYTGGMTNVPYGLDEECLENRANEVAHYLWRVARAAVVAELGEDSEFVPGYPPPSPSAP